MKPIAISTDVPKNGPRQAMLPSPPTEQRTDGDTETERGLVQDDRASAPPAGRADDGGQRGRNEERVAQTPAGAEADDHADAAEAPARAAKTTMSARPISRVCLAPIRLETKLVKNIANPVTSR